MILTWLEWQQTGLTGAGTPFSGIPTARTTG